MVGGLAVAAAAVVTLSAQAPAVRPLSGVGTASTEVGGQWAKTEKGSTYQRGKWIDVTYGRPRLRGRANIFGSGADYGKALLAGAPIWRAGADVTTRLKAEAPLMFGANKVPAGEYSLFIDAKENNWTLVVSSWAAQMKYDKANTAALWGAYGYTADKDVARIPMVLDMLPSTIEELTWAFVDMSATGGRMAIMWEKTMASVAFTAGM